MKVLFRCFVLALLLPLTIILMAGLMSCAGDAKQDCIANFKGSGLSLKISLVSGSTYRMELCGDSRTTYPAFTVYGAATENDISDNSILGRYRLSHVAANRSGDVFEVTFSSDLFFVLFADTNSQGGFQYANTNELIRGNLSQVVVALTPRPES